MGISAYFGRTFAENWSNQKSLWKQYLSIKYEHWSAHVVSFRDTQHTLKNQHCKYEIEILPTKTLNPHLHGIFKCMQMQNWDLKVFFFVFLVVLLNYLN